MREHEVPTHVGAEDRVLLGFTFPQIVAMTAVCALAYGVHRHAPIGADGVRTALAVVCALVGLALAGGRIGGRRLPPAVADLLGHLLGPRLHAGPPSELVRPAPAPARAARTGRGLRRWAGRRRRGGRMPFRPHGWFGKRRRRGDAAGPGSRPAGPRRPGPGPWRALVGIALLGASAAVVGPAVLAGDHRRDAIGFEEPEPAPGRRLLVEGLSVAGDRAVVSVRAAADLEVRVRAFGGPDGRALRFWGSARLGAGERLVRSLPLAGPAPSIVLSWEDRLGHAGAVALDGDRLPHPLPAVEGAVCDLRLASLGWTPGFVGGSVDATCADAVEDRVALPMLTGAEERTVPAAMTAGITAIAGTLAVDVGGRRETVAFVPDGRTAFRVPVAAGGDGPRGDDHGRRGRRDPDGDAPAGPAHPAGGLDRAPNRDGGRGAPGHEPVGERDGGGGARRRHRDPPHGGRAALRSEPDRPSGGGPRRRPSAAPRGRGDRAPARRGHPARVPRPRSLRRCRRAVPAAPPAARADPDGGGGAGAPRPR